MAESWGWPAPATAAAGAREQPAQLPRSAAPAATAATAATAGSAAAFRVVPVSLAAIEEYSSS